MSNLNDAVITTRFVLDDKSTIISVFKDNDGEWQFFGNEEGITEEDARVISLGEILEIDSSLKELLQIEDGSHAYRDSQNDEWKIQRYDE